MGLFVKPVRWQCEETFPEKASNLGKTSVTLYFLQPFLGFSPFMSPIAHYFLQMCNCLAVLPLILYSAGSSALAVLISLSCFLSQTVGYLQMPLKSGVTMHKSDGCRLDSHCPLQQAHTGKLPLQPAQCSLLSWVLRKDTWNVWIIREEIENKTGSIIILCLNPWYTHILNVGCKSNLKKDIQEKEQKRTTEMVIVIE